MTELSDEELMAFHDGELGGEEAETVRRALERDPRLRERLSRMRAVDDELRAAFAADLDMPERFAKILEPQGASNVVRLEHKYLGLRNWIPLGSAVAAGFAGLVAGSLLSAGTAPWLTSADDGVAIAGVVQTVASRTSSGERVTAGRLAVTPILSFVASDGRLCRELHVRGAQMAARMVACRDKVEVAWRLEALARMPTEDFLESYHTAGAPKDPVIDAAFARLGVKATLDPDGEKQAIARGWKAK